MYSVKAPRDKTASCVSFGARFIPTVPKRPDLGYSDGVRDWPTENSDRMSTFSNRLYRAVMRVVPTCVTQTQAIAFNMFLAFFPMLLVVLGIIATSTPLRDALQGLVVRLRPLLPPGTLTIISMRSSRDTVAHPLEWIFLGLGGTLLQQATQMMKKLMMEGFRIVHSDRQRADFVSRHVRALALLIVTIVPSIVIVNLIVFGKQVRNWMLHISSMPVLIRVVWSGIYILASLLIAMAVLSIIYRVGRPRAQTWKMVIPGAGCSHGAVVDRQYFIGFLPAPRAVQPGIWRVGRDDWFAAMDATHGDDPASRRRV